MTYTAQIVSGSVNGNTYKYKIRIPELNKAANAIGATPDSELYEARVLGPVGISPTYKIGDTVFVTFLTVGSGNPVILGLQHNEEALKKFSDARFKSLDVSTNSKLPEDTSIGEVTKDNIRCLINLNENIASKFTSLDAQDVEHTNVLSSHTTTLGKLGERVTLNELDIETNKGNIESLDSNYNTLNNNFNSHVLNEYKVTNNNSEVVHVSKNQITDWSTYTNMIRNNQLEIKMIKDREPIILSEWDDTTGSYGTELPTISGELKDGQLFFLLLDS